MLKIVIFITLLIIKKNYMIIIDYLNEVFEDFKHYLMNYVITLAIWAYAFFKMPNFIHLDGDNLVLVTAIDTAIKTAGTWIGAIGTILITHHLNKWLKKRKK